ncbi:MAG: hypothetical protein WBM11_14095 [Terriglobales bacterium]
MKRILFVVMLVAIFSFAVMAQDAKTPALTLSRTGNAARSSGGVTWGLPSVSKTIVFYGGDINLSDPNAQAFANGNTLAISSAQTYAAVKAPASGKTVVSGTFGNNTAMLGVFDPPEGTYDVRIGVSDGNGGTSLIHGTAAQTTTLTGRNPFGLVEYTTAVNFPKALTAQNGTTYWINENPQCTNTGDENCNGEFYYLSNTTQETNGVNAGAQVAGQLYLNSNYFGFTWINWCDSSLGQNSKQCARASFGLTK